MRFSFYFSLQNAGHSPAMLISTKAVVVADSLNSDLLVEQRKLCEPLRLLPRDRKTTDFSQFPGQDIAIGQNIYLFWQDIGNIQPSDNPHIWPALVGCVDYQFSSGDEHHQSGFIYDIMQIEPGNLSDLYPVDVRFIGDSDIPANALRLIRGNGAGFYAD